MKVAVFSRYPSDAARPKGGVESVTVVLVEALAQIEDLDVHVLTLEPGRTNVAVEGAGQVTVHRLPSSRWPQIFDVMLGPGKRCLTRYIERLKPDILHTHEVWGLGLGGIDVPHVFTVHGFDDANLIADSAKFAWVRSRLWKRVIRRGLASQTHIISITPYVRQVIERVTNARIYDIDNPVDTRFFGILGRPERGRILCTGWINERKNTLGSVEAFAHIAGRYPYAKLAVAGEAPEVEYLNRIKTIIDRQGIANQVEFLGHIGHTRLMDELARASVFLLPSRQENAPMAIAEAMAAGVPVIASNRCGMPYMVQEGQTGFLIDPESGDQIADRLTRLLDSPTLSHEMGLMGRQVAMKRFHPRAVAEKTVAVYRAMCAENRCPRAEVSPGVS
ncbi:MAG TPA: glycosyltransferase family 4 protein [Sedimentisphaerales bacterium]|nr:glycosyltransferase family 4 protein [Sedimentisphaerales bacterium]HRS10272.1 glycosyltransferase family 4 protein [Sedimentisphaerales bacterium]HRV46978.1 glycosyltransferase family 4 protein [Sedimentisphaerales bacterium]